MEQELFSAGVEAMRAFDKDRAALRSFGEACMRSHRAIKDKSSQVALIRLAELAFRAARSNQPAKVLDEVEGL